jgi:hypothetical protein
MSARAEPRRAGSETIPEEVSGARLRADRWGRRAVVAATALFVALGALNLFGVRRAEVAQTADAVTLTVEYAAVSRSGLSTPFAVTVRRVGGFDRPVVLAIDRAYLGLFGHLHVEPAPTTATASDRLVTWTFAPPGGEVLHIEIDGRIDPSVHAGALGSVAVMIGAVPAVAVSFRTRIMP